MKNYTQFKNLFFAEGTDENIKQVLETCYINNTRIIVDYGDINTGKSWGESLDICGTVGRTTGSVKAPILLYNSRSLGGCEILTNCIVSIKTSVGKKFLYKHKNYTPIQ